jgi:hypothetical protein
MNALEHQAYIAAKTAVASWRIIEGDCRDALATLPPGRSRRA